MVQTHRIRIESSTAPTTLLPGEIGPDGEGNAGETAIVLNGEPSVVLQGTSADLRDLADTIHACTNHNDAVSNRAAPAVLSIRMPSGHGFGDYAAVASLGERIAEWINDEYGVKPESIAMCQGSDPSAS